MAKKNWGYIDVSILDFTDKPTWDLLCRGETAGVFQLESSGMTEACLRIQPRDMEALIALIALYRPDTMRELEHYIKRRNGEEEVTYIHPDLIPILQSTYGCLIYQEQIMAITKVFAGFTNVEADKFRKGIGKKKKELVQEQADKFYKRCLEKGYPEDVAIALTEILKDMGGYSFNKGHATGYAITVFKTAFLKANYLPKYMCSLITNQKKEKGSTDYEGVGFYMVKCLELGIKVFPPDVNKAKAEFSEQDGDIIYGLKLVKGMSRTAVESVLQARPFNSFEDFLERCKGDVNKTNVIALVKAGAFDFTGKFRDSLLWQYEEYRFKNKLDDIKPVENINSKHIQTLLDEGVIKSYEAKDKDFCLMALNKWKRGKHRKEWEEDYMAGDIYVWEFESICYHLSGDPFEGTLLPTWNDFEEEDTAKVGGTIIALKKTKIKKGKQIGKQMAFISLSTSEGMREVTVFANEFERFQDLLVKGSNVVMKGKKQGDGLIMSGIKTLEDYKLTEE